MSEPGDPVVDAAAATPTGGGAATGDGVAGGNGVAGPSVGGGGVPWRPSRGGAEVVLVRHRATGRWELPKGKPEAGEAPWCTARREVAEETGLECRLVEELATVEFVDRARWRAVRYWLMEPADAGALPCPQPATETAEARWCRLGAGEPVVCQPYDALVLASFATALARRGVVLPAPPVGHGPGWRLLPAPGGGGWAVVVADTGSVVARLRAPAAAGPAWHAGGTDEAGPSSAVSPSAAGGSDATPGRGADEEVRR